MFSFKQSIQLIQLTGPDACDFINNQIINRFDSTVKQPHFSAICNPKGRIMFSLLIWQNDDSIYLAVDASLIKQLLQYITMRRFRMKFNINPHTEYVVVAPDKSINQVSDLSISDNEKHTAAQPEDFWRLMFRSELPWITLDTTEQFIPQNLSLDQHQLIEYEKGCYPGQEIIARLHFLGQNKKQMVLIVLEAGSHYKNGQKVTINDNQVQLCSPIIKHNDQLQAQVVKSNR